MKDRYFTEKYWRQLISGMGFNGCYDTNYIEYHKNDMYVRIIFSKCFHSKVVEVVSD